MILESYYWKKELIKTSKKITKKIKIPKNWKPSKHASFEKEIMLGFYIIRKLMDANKLTNKICSSKFDCKVYSNNGKQVTLLNKFSIEENYNLENSKIQKLDLKFLINQFIHSYIFSPVIKYVDEQSLNLLEKGEISDEELAEITENGTMELCGIFFNSDTNKNKYLYEIDISQIINIFDLVGNCNVTRIEMKFNPKKGEYDTIQFDGENEILDETKIRIDNLESQNE
ncbi:MAG: hypothetical protein V4581_02325 [Bacteroidota bacterium]